MTTRLQKTIIGIGMLIGILVLWFFVTRNGIDTLFLPTPESFWKSFISMSHNGLWKHLGITTLRVFVAVFISFLVAIPTALMMYGSKVVRLIISPIIDFVRYLPVPALIPLLILFLGIGESVKITVLFIGTFFQVVILMFDYIKNIHEEYYELAYVFHFSSIKKWRMQIAAILPELWDTLRISIGWCWTYIIIAELIATDVGIGRVIKEAQRFSDSSKLYVAIVLIGITGLIIDQLMKYLAPKLFPYRYIKNI
jgi:NitT/TauT family transport system permease protein